jgi:hypothetical protein
LSKPAVLIFADADDIGVSRLVSHLKDRSSVTWWRFGVSESSVSVDVDQHSFRIEQPGSSVSSTTIRDADIVVYRRRLLQPRPLVISDLPSPEDRGFSEREWTSLIDGLLLTAERGSRSTWLNSPSATLLAHNKLALLLRASRMGLSVPAFSISTPVHFPPSSRSGLVAKAISSDEQIDTIRHFSTALLSPEDLRNLPGTRLPTPSLVQEYIPADFEIRVFYLLGEFFALALTPSRKHVDIRHTPRSELSPQPHDLSLELRRALAGLAGSLSLGYCTFDLVAPRGGPPMLLDVTPNGDWAHFESDTEPIVTKFIGDTITAHKWNIAQERR